VATAARFLNSSDASTLRDVGAASSDQYIESTAAHRIQMLTLS